MAIKLLFAPEMAFSLGVFAPGAKAYFYKTGTTTAVTTYSDSGYTTPHANPVVADAAGVFPAVFYSGVDDVKAVITDASDATISTIDPVGRVGSSGSGADGISFSPVIGNLATDVQTAIENLTTDVNTLEAASFSTAITAGNDLNTLAGDGFFDWNSTSVPSNGPAAATDGVLLQVDNGTTKDQMIVSKSVVYVRRYESSAWTAWQTYAPRSTDGTLAGNSDTVVPTEKAVKTYADARAITQTTGTAPYYGARAWCTFTGAAGTIVAQSNIASVTHTGLGDFDIVFTEDMPDANFAVLVTCHDGSFGIADVHTRATTGFSMTIGSRGSTNLDPTTCFFAVFR